MISAELVREIISVYGKHGWQISRVLLSGIEGAADAGPELAELLGDAQVNPSRIDAIWFERPSKRGRTAIELRLISPEPFALFELVDADAGPDELARVRNEMEQKAEERASKSQSGRSH